MSQKQHPTLNRSILMNPSARSRLFKENLGRGPQRCAMPRWDRSPSHSALSS
jgi:hypothetical protein